MRAYLGRAMDGVCSESELKAGVRVGLIPVVLGIVAVAIPV